LQGVGGGGELPPVDEHTHGSAGFAKLSGVRQPRRRPPGPGALVLGVSLKGRRRVVPHTGILFGS
jgi:hypothetical protein